MTSSSGILKVGITGGIGSGKSLVCSYFERTGYPVLYADRIAHEITDSDERVKREIVRLLGPEAYLPNGRLNRPFVASKIFEQKPLQRKINRIVHPRVIEEINRRLDQSAKAGHHLGFVEAALIYEAGLDAILDYVVVVEADEATRIARVVQRDGVTEEQVRQRLDAQWKSSEKVKRADFILYNNGTREELMERVRFLHQLLQHLTPS